MTLAIDFGSMLKPFGVIFMFLRDRFVNQFSDGIFIVCMDFGSEWHYSLGSIVVVFGHPFGLNVDRFGHLFGSILVSFVINTLPFGTRGCKAPAANSYRYLPTHPATSRHPRRKGHVQNLAEDNLRTDARIINYCHHLFALHSNFCPVWPRHSWFPLASRASACVSH